MSAHTCVLARGGAAALTRDVKGAVARSFERHYAQLVEKIPWCRNGAVVYLLRLVYMRTHWPVT